MQIVFYKDIRIFHKEVSIMSVINGVNQSFNGIKTDGDKKTSKSGSDSKKSSDSTKAATFEKSEGTAKQATYKINKMSAKERDAMVSQLKADAESRQKSFLDIVNKTINGQGKTYAIAMDSDEMWQKIASGDFEVDPETRAKAKEDIAEDGYWGVNQTAQRLFDFASALAGDDENKMKEMQEAMMKGFKEATKSWGKSLPEISQQTLDKANQLFEDYYKSKT